MSINDKVPSLESSMNNYAAFLDRKAREIMEGEGSQPLDYERYRDEAFWAAGIAEGEGCFYAKVNDNGHVSVRFQLQMTDYDIVEKMAEIIRVLTFQSVPPRQPGQKPSWRINAAGPKAELFMWRMFPLLGERRRDKILEIAQLLITKDRASFQP